MVAQKPPLFWLILVISLVLGSCSSAGFNHVDQGWVLVNYYNNPEKGIRGVVPVDLGEEIIVAQEVFPGEFEDLKTATLETTDLEELPPSTGIYQGSALKWQLYQFETQIADVGPFTVSVILGLATDDSASYFVGLVTLPEIFESETEKILSIFYHTLYAYTPLE
jgi:hypothetical protein